MRGKVFFALDNTDEHRTDYLRGNPSLEGRMLFVSSNPGEPSAAFIKMNEALGQEEERIRRNVRESVSDPHASGYSDRGSQNWKHDAS